MANGTPLTDITNINSTKFIKELSNPEIVNYGTPGSSRMRYQDHRPLPCPSNSNYDRQPPFTNKKSFDHRSVINDAEFDHAIDLTQSQYHCYRIYSTIR